MAQSFIVGSDIHNLALLGVRRPGAALAHVAPGAAFVRETQIMLSRPQLTLGQSCAGSQHSMESLSRSVSRWNDDQMAPYPPPPSISVAR